MTSYKDMPSDSRVWVYQSNREFTNEETQEIQTKAAAFIETWAAHQVQLKAYCELRYNRFLILMVDEKQAMASGCSIDTSVRFIKELETLYNNSFFNRLEIAYKKNNAANTFHLNKLEELIACNMITKSSIIFNNLIATKSELESNWEIPLQNSWLKA